MLFPNNLFNESDKVLRIWHQDEWFYSIEDVIVSINDEMGIVGANTFDGLGMISKTTKNISGKSINFTNLQGIFRIIQSIDHKNAEPFKLWLAKLGKERIERTIRETEK